MKKVMMSLLVAIASLGNSGNVNAGEVIYRFTNGMNETFRDVTCNTKVIYLKENTETVISRIIGALTVKYEINNNDSVVTCDNIAVGTPYKALNLTDLKLFNQSFTKFVADMKLNPDIRTKDGYYSILMGTNFQCEAAIIRKSDSHISYKLVVHQKGIDEGFRTESRVYGLQNSEAAYNEFMNALTGMAITSGQMVNRKFLYNLKENCEGVIIQNEEKN